MSGPRHQKIARFWDVSKVGHGVKSLFLNDYTNYQRISISRQIARINGRYQAGKSGLTDRPASGVRGLRLPFRNHPVEVFR